MLLMEQGRSAPVELKDRTVLRVLLLLLRLLAKGLAVLWMV